MSTDALRTGPDRDALTDLIRERWPDAVVLSIDSATFFSLDEKHWQRWISILNPSDATVREVVLPLLTEAHDRLAASRARRPAG